MHVDEKLLSEIESKMDSIDGYLNIIHSHLAGLKQPEKPACCNISDLEPDIKAVSQMVDDLRKSIKKSKASISTIADDARRAEQIALGMTIDGSLINGLSYYGNSMGGGASNVISDENIYANKDDKFVVKYIAIYDGDRYVANIYGEENNGKSLDEIIAQLKAEGKISENADIKIAKGIARADEERTSWWRYRLVAARRVQAS